MIGPDCDDDYPSSHPLLAAVIGALGAVLAAGIGPWLAHQREREREERKRADRLARLEALYERVPSPGTSVLAVPPKENPCESEEATEEDDADDGDGGPDAG